MKDLHIGVRASDDRLDDFLRRVLAAHLVTDVEAVPNYSIALASAPKNTRAAGFHLLHRNSYRVLRTRDPSRLVRGLFNHLDSHEEPPEGVIRINGLPLIGERGAFVAPTILRQYLAQMERRLNLRGVRIVDSPWALVDHVRGELIVPEPSLTVDWTPFDELDELAPGSRPDPTVPPGRYPMTGWAFLGYGPPPSRAQAVALASRLTVGVGDLGGQEYLEALAAVMSDIEPARLEWDSPAKLAEPILTMMSGGT